MKMMNSKENMYVIWILVANRNTENEDGYMRNQVMHEILMRNQVMHEILMRNQEEYLLKLVMRNQSKIGYEYANAPQVKLV
jgi:hypothetical protein